MRSWRRGNILLWQFLGQDCYYQIVRQNFMPLSLAGAPREADIAQHVFPTMASAPVAQPFRNIRACFRKTLACCDCAPWLASGYITSWASGRCCARMKALIGLTTTSLCPCTTKAGWQIPVVQGRGEVVEQQQREVSRPAEAPIGEPDASDLNEFGGSRFMRSIGHEDIP